MDIPCNKMHSHECVLSQLLSPKRKETVISFNFFQKALRLKNLIWKNQKNRNEKPAQAIHLGLKVWEAL